MVLNDDGDTSKSTGIKMKYLSREQIGEQISSGLWIKIETELEYKIGNRLKNTLDEAIWWNILRKMKGLIKNPIYWEIWELK